MSRYIAICFNILWIVVNLHTPCAAAKIEGFDEDKLAGVPTGS